MKAAKIIIKSNYNEKHDLVFRPLIRAYEKIGAYKFLEKGNAVILGKVSENGLFYELFSGKAIDYPKYELCNIEDYVGESIDSKTILLIRSVILKVLFNEEIDLGFEVSTMEDLALDRRIDFDAYNRDLIDHNAYSEPYSGYNDFSFKTKILTK